MKINFRILALLLTLLFVLTACVDGGIETEGSTAEISETVSLTETDTEKVTETQTETESLTEEATETVTESETETETEQTVKPLSPVEEARLKISRSPEEVEAMFNLTDEDFVKVEEKLKAFEELALVSEDYDAVDALYVEFEDMYYHIETQVSIASIIYYIDMSNEKNSTRYLDFYEKYGDLYNMYIESCKNVYNNSPIRDELFADWTEEDIEELFAYDPETQELREKNEELLVVLNELSDEAMNVRAPEIYAEIVTNNNLIAELSGYDNYYEYASKEMYNREYGVEDVELFRDYIIKHYVPNLSAANKRWELGFRMLDSINYTTMYTYLFSPFDALSKNYFYGYIESFEGSTREGFEHMLENRNIVFANSSDSHQSAFQTYLTELETPFCLFGSAGQSTETIVHEMGHYYAALYNPDIVDLDLAETQSQGNEMLLLQYLDGKMSDQAYKVVRGYTLYSFIAESILCTIIDEFEREVYALDSVEGYTYREFDAIMAKVCENYGGIDFVNENITDVNYYWRVVATNNPVYYISYAVSMTEALNIYAEVEEDQAKGREVYRILVEDVTEEDTFLTAIEKAGLSSPFVEQTFIDIIDTVLN